MGVLFVSLSAISTFTGYTLKDIANRFKDYEAKEQVFVNQRDSINFNTNMDRKFLRLSNYSKVFPKNNTHSWADSKRASLGDTISLSYTFQNTDTIDAYNVSLKLKYNILPHEIRFYGFLLIDNNKILLTDDLRLYFDNDDLDDIEISFVHCMW